MLQTIRGYQRITAESKRLSSPSPCRNPMVTGTSVLGVKFTGGVIIAADMLGSYGSLARFRNISRLMKVTVTVDRTSSAVWVINVQLWQFLIRFRWTVTPSWERPETTPTTSTSNRSSNRWCKLLLLTLTGIITTTCLCSDTQSVLWLVCQYRRGAAGWRSQLQSQGGPLLAHQSHVQPALQDESSVEHGGDRRLLQRREVTAASVKHDVFWIPAVSQIVVSEFNI